MAIDEEWDKHFKDISQKDWDKLISDALKYWDELNNDKWFKQGLLEIHNS